MPNNVIPQVSGNNNIVKLADAQGNPEYFIRMFKQGHEVLIPLSDVLGKIEDDIGEITKLFQEGTSEENKLVNEDGLAKAAGSVQDKGPLTDGDLVEVTNNAVQTLSTSRSTITVNVTPEGGQSPNFALEITPSQDLTITVTKTVGNTVTNLYPSNAGGNVADAGGYYQLTCVGNCWTLAPFTVPVKP